MKVAARRTNTVIHTGYLRDWEEEESYAVIFDLFVAHALRKKDSSLEEKN